MTVRQILVWIRRHVLPRDVMWMAVLAVVVSSMILVSRVSRDGHDLRTTRETPSVIVVNRNPDEPAPVAPAVIPPTHVIHLACDQAQRELEEAVDAALDFSADLDRLLHGAEGKPIAADPRLVAQFQLIRGRERIPVTDIRRRMAEVGAVRADPSYEGDEDRARAVFVNVIDVAAWARGIADSYRSDRRLVDSLNWTAHQLRVEVRGENPDLADVARDLWVSPGELRRAVRGPRLDDSLLVEEDLAFYDEAPRARSTLRVPLRDPGRIPPSSRVLRKPPGTGSDRTPPRRRPEPTASTRGALNLVDLIRANLEWNGLTDVSLRRREGTVVASGEVRSEREMAELEAIVESVLHTSELEFENRVRVDG